MEQQEQQQQIEEEEEEEGEVLLLPRVESSIYSSEPNKQQEQHQRIEEEDEDEEERNAGEGRPGERDGQSRHCQDERASEEEQARREATIAKLQRREFERLSGAEDGLDFSLCKNPVPWRENKILRTIVEAMVAAGYDDKPLQSEGCTWNQPYLRRQYVVAEQEANPNWFLSSSDYSICSTFSEQIRGAMDYLEEQLTEEQYLKHHGLGPEQMPLIVSIIRSSRKSLPQPFKHVLELQVRDLNLRSTHTPPSPSPNTHTHTHTHTAASAPGDGPRGHRSYLSPAESVVAGDLTLTLTPYRSPPNPVPLTLTRSRQIISSSLPVRGASSWSCC